MNERNTIDCNLYVDYDGVILIIGIKISRVTLWRWVQEGRFPKSTKLAGTRLAWKRSDVIEWLEETYEKRHLIHYAELR